MNIIDQVINDAVAFAVSMANDNSHGYSQAVRSLYNFKNPTSFDCSSLVCTAYQYAFEKNGIKPTPKDMGCTYTGNMLGLLKCGFEVAALNQTSNSNMKKGDVELHVTYHTALAIDGNNIVHARSSEGTSDTRDNSGNEIRTQAWYKYSKGWTHRLRFTGKGLDLPKGESFDGVALTEIAKYVEAEFGMAAADSYGDNGYNCLLGVAQTIFDEYNHGGFGSGVAAVLKNNFTKPAAGYSARTLQAVRDVFINKKKRFADADVLQFRSFYSYGTPGNSAQYDKVKCAGLDAKYDYLGYDSIGPSIGHHYWGIKKKAVEAPKSLSDTPKWSGVVKGTKTLKVRKWAGTEYETCSFSPLQRGETVQICDTIQDVKGTDWYFILYKGKYGFVAAKYIKGV